MTLFKQPTGHIATDSTPSGQAEYTRHWVQSLVKSGLQGFKLDTDDFSYQYNVQTAIMNTDPFVRKALERWDREFYHGCDGWTKTVDIKTGLQDLAEYNRPNVDLENILQSPEFSSSLSYAVQRAVEVFQGHDLKPLRLEDAANTLHGNTSAGFSFPTFKKGDCIGKAFDLARYMSHMIRDKRNVYIPPVKLGFRGHLSQIEDKKVRSVWIYPVEVTMLENVWARSYYQHLEEKVPQVFFGPGSFERLWLRLTRPLRMEREVTFDWSKFDKTIPNFLIDIAFDIIENSFDRSYQQWVDMKGEVHDYAAKDYTPVLNWLRKYFKYTRIMLPDSTILLKTHGVPSGSMFTQAIDSIVNYIVVTAICHHLQLSISDLCVLGDDSHFRMPDYLDLPVYKISEIARYFFGMDLNPRKVNDTEISRLRTFIGYKFNGAKPVRDTKEWFLRALYSERDVQNLAVSASRIIGLLMIGGCNDDTFFSFAKYFFNCYPNVEGRVFVPGQEISRTMKYVFHRDFNLYRIPALSEIKWSHIPYHLSMDLSVI